ncbi:hypothetical protein [Actinophytocola sp.]|uniref:hypothetical protein n=1 Tax=Actinophytocola sp. TaxID=1872138 RepID=UPI00389A564D
MRHRRAVVTVIAAVATVATAVPAAAAIVTTGLGPVAGEIFSQATSVRDDGVAVGYSTPPTGGTHAVLWDASGAVTELATPGRNSEAHDINSTGVVVGEAEPSGVERAFPVSWDVTGVLTALPGGVSGSARGVNDAGVIVGFADSDGQSPLRWENSTTWPTWLATLPGGANDSVAYDLNNEGAAVGYSRGADGARHAVVWNAVGAVGQLATPSGYADCFAYEINDSGLIVGSCFGSGGNVAVRWDVTGAVAVLPTLGPAEAEASGVSDAGLIVGYAADINGRYYAVRWGAYGTITKLPTLGGTHGVALDINNTGTVVGRTNQTDGSFRATSWRNAG